MLIYLATNFLKQEKDKRRKREKRKEWGCKRERSRGGDHPKPNLTTVSTCWQTFMKSLVGGRSSSLGPQTTSKAKSCKEHRK